MSPRKMLCGHVFALTLFAALYVFDGHFWAAMWLVGAFSMTCLIDLALWRTEGND